MSGPYLLRGAFVPPGGVYVHCGDEPDAWIADPVVAVSGRGRHTEASIVAERVWELVESTCAACPALEACREHGLRPENVDDPMVYGGLSTHERQMLVRGRIRTSNGTTTRVRRIDDRED